MEEHDKTSKLIMWSKINELISNGLKKSQISRLLGLDRGTVRRYASMSLEEFTASTSYERMYVHKLDPYEGFVVDYLTEFPFVSAAQVHDHLREKKPDFPKVSDKTVFNFVRRLRLTHDIPKEEEDEPRQMRKLPETAYGEYAQVDFGERTMYTADGSRVRVYFMVMVLSRSRYKFVYFSRTPFTSALAVYAHGLAFSYFGGKPEKLVYDQDRVFIHDENLGDYLLTARFKAFVSSEGLEVVFCRKSDPQSKGKVENAVKYVKNNFLSARRFKDIDTLNAEGLAWLERTANGTEHHGIRRIPAEVFAEEKEWLRPYCGTPALPEESMELRTVRQDNTVMYAGCYYTLPPGTYRGRNSKVYVEERSGTVNIYDVETGKTVTTHPCGTVKGQTVRNMNHLRHNLDLFDFNHSEAMSQSRMKELRELTWMEQAYNIILMGPSGTGKTFIASGLVHDAVRAGFRASVMTMEDLVTTIRLKDLSPTCLAAYNRLLKLHLLAIDDIMMFPMKKEEANAFFNLINTLHEKASVIITTNKAPTEWAQRLDDEVLATAILDRLMYRCQIIKLTGDSYRMANRKTIFKD